MATRRTQRPATTATVAATGSAGAVRSEHKARSADQPAATAPADEEVDTRLFNLQFELIRNINYHIAREAFLGRMASSLIGLQVLFGTAAFSVIATKLGPWGLAEIVALTGATIGIVLLILDPAGKARDHRGFRSRYSSLLADLTIGCEEPGLNDVQAEIYKISAEEPPTYNTLRALAFNETVRALYQDDEVEKYSKPINFYHRLTAQLFPRRGKIYNSRP